MRAPPALDALVELPAGRYELGEPGEERACELSALLIGRWPVVNADVRRFLDATGRSVPAAVEAETLAHHPATGLSARRRGGVLRLGERGARPPRAPADRGRVGGGGARARRPPLSVGRDVRPRPLRVRGGRLGLDGAGRRAPGRRRPVRGRAAGRQRLGVGRRPHRGRLERRARRQLPRPRWGLRASRAQPADPERATITTGFRIAVSGGRTPPVAIERGTGCPRS